MNLYEYKGVQYTINELSEISGIKPATIRQRLRSGYDLTNALKERPIHTSVELFSEASWWMDWEGKTIEELHRIYCKWCEKFVYVPVAKQTFGKEIQLLFPIYTVPSFYKGIYTRKIRFKE
jgi:hypothetical protein